MPYLKVQCSTRGKFGKGVILGKQPDTFVKMIVWRCPFQSLNLRQFVSQFLFYVVQGVPNIPSLVFYFHFGNNERDFFE